jgi:hypothetical protein
MSETPANAVAALERPKPGPSRWTTAVTSQDGTTEIHHRTSIDHVTLVMVSDDGAETHYASFTIDDYGKRLASGDVEAYVQQRAYPKVRRAWRPDCHEASRRVDHYVAADGEWVLEPQAPAELAEVGS